jgi:hypothetical protein
MPVRDRTAAPLSATRAFVVMGSGSRFARPGRRRWFDSVFKRRSRRVGKGALAPCPPILLDESWWARCALPTLRNSRFNFQTARSVRRRSFASRGAVASELLQEPPPENRGRRESRVRRSHPQPRVQNFSKHTSVVTTGSPVTPSLPCAMVLTAASCSPRRPGSFATVAGGIASANLTPASGCQDHTTLPSALVSLVNDTAASTASRSQRS